MCACMHGCVCVSECECVCVLGGGGGVGEYKMRVREMGEIYVQWWNSLQTAPVSVFLFVYL